MCAIDARLATILAGKTPIVVWGVGQLTFKLLAMTRLADVPIRAFLDTNPTYHGATLRGAPILRRRHWLTSASRYWSARCSTAMRSWRGCASWTWPTGPFGSKARQSR